jgi:ferrochelatase
MSPNGRPHLLLVNLGTPTAATPAAVRSFLEEFLSDPSVVDYPRWLWQPILRGFILRSRPKAVAEQYASIWTSEGSPLRVATERSAALVRARAADRFGVSTAYRYGEPSIDREIGRLAREHDGPIVISPLFPQRTDSTTGTAFDRARAAAMRAGVRHRLVESLLAPSDAGYVAALASRWRGALQGLGWEPEHVVVSFHGIPRRYDRNEGGVYRRDCEETTRAFLGAIDWSAARTTLAYQSQFGPERWIGPSTAQVLESLPRRGIRRVAVITPGFVTDGLETIEEIGERGRESFLRAGGVGFVRIGAVESEDAFVDALCALADIGVPAPHR